MAPFAPDPERLAKAHDRLLLEIAADAHDTKRWTGRGAFSDKVMAAMAKVPRHEFVPPDLVVAAYVNRPQSIGFGQTISQPYMVALMTDLLDPETGHRVLEIGTGCGYQTAVLAEVVGRVYSVEVIPDLAESAGKRLKRMGYGTVEVRCGDGHEGWPEEAPFDSIIVTAAPERLPDALTRQLKTGGRMVIPLGRHSFAQSLYLGIKQADGSLKTESVLPVAFVPMVRRNERRPFR